MVRLRSESEAQTYLYKTGNHLTYKADKFLTGSLETKTSEAQQLLRCGEIFCEKMKSEEGLNYHNGQFYGNGRAASDSFKTVNVFATLYHCNVMENVDKTERQRIVRLLELDESNCRIEKLRNGQYDYYTDFENMIDIFKELESKYSIMQRHKKLNYTKEEVTQYGEIFTELYSIDNYVFENVHFARNTPNRELGDRIGWYCYLQIDKNEFYFDVGKAGPGKKCDRDLETRTLEHLEKDKHQIIGFLKFYALPESLTGNVEDNLSHIEDLIVNECARYLTKRRYKRESFFIPVTPEAVTFVHFMDKTIQEIICFYEKERAPPTPPLRLEVDSTFDLSNGVFRSERKIVIAANVNIKCPGDMHCNALTIEGNGSLSVKTLFSERMVIKTNATLIGNANCGSVEVCGKIDGHLKFITSDTITATAEIKEMTKVSTFEAV